jgi:hypothetical protein
MKCGASSHGVPCAEEARVFFYPMPRFYWGYRFPGLEVPLCNMHFRLAARAKHEAEDQLAAVEKAIHGSQGFIASCGLCREKIRRVETVERQKEDQRDPEG